MANTYSDQLKLRMPALGDTGWDDELHDNIKILEVFLAAIKQGNSVVSGLAPTDGGGLDVDYAAGVADVGDARRTVSASSKTCTAGVKNWLYVDSSGVMQISTTAPTGDFCPVAMIDAGVASIDRIADLRHFGRVSAGVISATAAASIADESEITLPTGIAGWGFAQAGDNEEYIEFAFTAAGAVTVLTNSANAVNADTDGNLCVYDAGSGIAIKNRLGATKTIRYNIQYS